MSAARAGIGSATLATISAAANVLVVPVATDDAASDLGFSCIGRTDNRLIPASFSSGSGR